MDRITHDVPVASPEQIAAGWSGVFADPQTRDLYLVPVDPADATVCEACE